MERESEAESGDKQEKRESGRETGELDSLPKQRTEDKVKNWLTVAAEKKKAGDSEKETERRRRGRPTNAERLGNTREASNSSRASSAAKRERGSETDGVESEEETERQEAKRIKGKQRAISKEEEMEEMMKALEAHSKVMRKEFKEMKDQIRKDMEDAKNEQIKEVEKWKNEQQREVEKWKNEQQQRIEEWRKEERKLVQDVQKENRDLRERVKELEKYRLEQEKKERRCNIVIKGAEAEDKPARQAVKEVLEKIGKEKNVNVVDAFKIRNGIIVAKISSIEEKSAIMRNRAKLRGTNVYIDDDLMKYERERQNRLRVWANEKRKDGMNVRVKYGKVVMNGKEYVWDECDKRMREKGFQEVLTM